jgi:hypothetical protein
MSKQGQKKLYKKMLPASPPKPSPALFPFHLLLWWFKYEPSDDICVVCHKKPVAYRGEGYLDGYELLRMIDRGRDSRAATNSMWAKSLAAQCRGHYTNYVTSILCRECTLKAITSSVGEKAAHISLMPTMLLGLPGSIIIGSRLETPQDDGKNFVFRLPARIATIDELAAMMQKKAVGIQV